MGKRTAWDRLNIKDKLDLVESLARDGLTDEQIAEQLGVSKRTLHRWKKEHPEFDEALARGKAVPDAKVENALYKLATGFEYVEDHVTPTGKVVKVRKYHPPHPTSVFYWLKNRRPDKWRDKREIEHSGPNGGPIEFIAAWGEDDGGGTSEN